MQLTYFTTVLLFKFLGRLEYEMDSKRINCLQVSWLGINILLTYWLLSKLFTSSNVFNIP